jgi:hypothetical protein
MNDEEIPLLSVSEYNPYKNICRTQEDKCTNTSNPIYFGKDMYFAEDNETIQKILDLEQYSRVVRTMTIVDFILNMFNFFVSGQVFYVFISFVSYIGFVGSRDYKHDYLIGYIYYQLLLCITRYALLILYIYMKYNNKIHINNHDILILPISAAIQTAICSCVIKFFKMLPM